MTGLIKTEAGVPCARRNLSLTPKIALKGWPGPNVGEARQRDAERHMPKSLEPCRDIDPEGAAGGGNAADVKGRHVVSVRHVLDAEPEGEMVVDFV